MAFPLFTFAHLIIHYLTITSYFDVLYVFIFLGYIIFSFIFIGILKLISKLIDSFIYKSEKFIFYSAFSFISFEALEVLLFKNFEKNDFLTYAIVFSYFICLVLVLYYNWDYRREIAAGLFLINFINRKTDIVNSVKPDYVSKLFRDYFGIANLSNFSKGLILLFVLGVFLLITVLLRKKGFYVYDSKIDREYMN